MPSAHDEDTVREDVQDFIDVPKTAAIHAVSLVKSWSKARRLRFLMGVIEVQNAAKNCGRRNTQRVVRAQGGVKPGGAKKLVHVLSKYVFPNSRNTTAIGSICANSKAAMGLSPSGELRTFYVGQVVVLKNDDAKKENWYVMITKLTAPSISNPKRVGYGVWLWGQEDVRAHPGCRRFVMEGSDREVMLSEYEFEINVDNVIAVCRANPGFLDNGLENDLVYHSYFDYAEKAIHALTEPTTPGRQKDLATVLLLHRSIALRANPVSPYSVFLVVCVVFIPFFFFLTTVTIRIARGCISDTRVYRESVLLSCFLLADTMRYCRVLWRYLGSG